MAEPLHRELTFIEKNLPEKIVMGECWPRDGLQNEHVIVPTSGKIEMITRMVDAGFTKIEATSFAHPRYLPQFRDAEEVLRNIPHPEHVDYRAICTNMRGIERAMDCKQAGYGVSEIAMVLSSSEAHNLANVNMDHAENKKLLEKMTRHALDSGHDVFGWALTSFGCPINGDVPVEDALAVGQWWKDIGARYIGFGDTTGASNPVQVARFYERVLEAGFTRDEIVIHFHDTRGWGVANSMVCLAMGFKLFDTSFGAVGGQPQTGAAMYHRGFAGNTCTEDLVGMFEEMGVDTGIDQEGMMAIGRRAEELLGRQLRSNYLQAGRVPHRGITYSKAHGIQD